MQIYSKLYLLKTVVVYVFVCVISKVSTIQQAFLLQMREAILFAQRPSCTRKLVNFGKGAVRGGACLEFQHFVTTNTTKHLYLKQDEARRWFAQ